MARPAQGERGEARSKNGTQARGAWDLLDGIKQGLYYKRKLDVDLEDLRSLAMGEGGSAGR